MKKSMLTVSLLLFLPLASPAQSVEDSSAKEEAFRRDLQQGVGAHLSFAGIQSPGHAERAAQQLAAYFRARAGLKLPDQFVADLAQAEWRARSNGRASIPVLTFTKEATQFFMEELGIPIQSAADSAGPTPFFVVTPEKLNAARQLYARHIPSAVRSEIATDAKELNPRISRLSSIQKVYPIEAFLLLYLCVSEDLGRSEGFLRNELAARGEDTAALSTGRRPFGDAGYFLQRPVSRLFKEATLTKLLGTAE